LFCEVGELVPQVADLVEPVFTLDLRELSCLLYLSLDPETTSLKRTLLGMGGDFAG
jgi:hypothetical protein